MSDERMGYGIGRGLRNGLKSHTGIFVAGLALGSVAVKVLTSRDARDFYTQLIAAGLRAKECTMDTVNTVQEHIEDMVAEAKFINRIREEEAEYGDFDDFSCTCGEDDCEFCGCDDEFCTCGEDDCEFCNPKEEE